MIINLTSPGLVSSVDKERSMVIITNIEVFTADAIFLELFTHGAKG